jgi:anti-sigma factor RsiW
MTPLERDLHAFADRRLPPEAAARVGDWLAENPEAAARVRDWQRQNELLHAAYDPLLDQPVPDRWQQLVARAGRRRWLPLAAAAGWLAIGGFLGFLVGGAGNPPPAESPLARSAAPTAAPDDVPVASPQALPAADDALPRQAAIAHAVYAPEVRHPVEVGADQEAHLVQWLSKRLGQPLAVPSLAAEGYTLVGGRLLPGSAGPVAQFMYEDPQGRRLTLYVSPPEANQRESAFRYAEKAGLGIFYWVDPRFAYALTGDLDRRALLAAAESAWRQLEASRPAP